MLPVDYDTILTEVPITSLELAALRAVPWHRNPNAGILGDLRYPIAVGSPENQRALVALLLRAARDLPPHIPGLLAICETDPTPPAIRIINVATRVAAA